MSIYTSEQLREMIFYCFCDDYVNTIRRFDELAQPMDGGRLLCSCKNLWWIRELGSGLTFVYRKKTDDFEAVAMES